MNIRDALNSLAQQPASLGARARLAIALTEAAHPKAPEVWAATARLAARRGRFFSALRLCRRHLQPEQAVMVLKEIAKLYGAARVLEGPRQPPPAPTSRPLELPESPEALAALAAEVGADIEALCLPLNARLPDVPVFSALPEHAFLTLAAALEEVKISTGDVLAKEGELSTEILQLVRGTAVVRQQRADQTVVELAQIKAPALIGEMSLLTAVPRRASVVATSPGLAWRISEQTLRDLAKAHPLVVSQLAELTKRRLLANLAQNSVLFLGLSDHNATLASFELLTTGQDEEVFAQGVAPPGLYLLLHGAAEVWVSSAEGTSAKVATLTEGDAFGEISLLTGQPTSASVRMPDGGVLLHLPASKWSGQPSEALAESLTALAEVRKGDLQDLVVALDGELELVDESWLAEESWLE